MGDVEITVRDAGKSWKLPTGQQHRFKVRMMRVSFLEVEDVLFHHSSAVMMPDNDDGSGTPDQNRISGIEVLRAIYLHAADHADQKLLLAGHADTTGDDATNEKFSKYRAQNVLHLLLGEKDPWVKICEDHHKTIDIKQILRYCAKSLGFLCDPGSVNNTHDKAMDAAVKNFQQSFSSWSFGYEIKDDGVVGKETWGAFFTVYMVRLRELAGVGEPGLQTMRDGLKFLWDDTKYVGCGEYHPVDMPGKDSYESAENRRVEALFYESGEEPPEKPANHLCHKGGKKEVKKCLLYNAALYSYVYIKPKSLRLVSLDPQFAPVAESIDIGYRLLGLSDKPVKLDIASETDPAKVLFSRDLTDEEKSDGVHLITWDGRCSAGDLKDKAAHPLLSPYRVDIHDGEAHHAVGSVKVLYHSLELKQGPWTADEKPPDPGDEKAWVAYRLNELGYYGGPVGKDTESYLERAIVRYKAHHKALHQLDYSKYNGSITDALKKALAAGDNPQPWLVGDPFGSPATESRLFVEALTYETSDEFGGNKSTFEQARLNRPLVPVEATIYLKGKSGDKVLAPEGVGPVRVTWAVTDTAEDLSGQPTDAPKRPSRTKEYIELCLALNGGDTAGAENCDLAFGGIRDAAKGSAHKAGLTGNFYVPHVVEEDGDANVLFTKACVDGAKFPKRLGKAGFLFRPSHIAGDDYQITAFLDFKKLPNEDALRAAHGLADDTNIQAMTGTFRIWRTGKVALRITWPPRTNSPEWNTIADEFRKAWLEVDMAHMVTKKFTDVMPADDYRKIVAKNTKHKKGDISLLENAYVGVKLPKQGKMNAADYKDALKTFTYTDYWNLTIYPLRERLSEILRKDFPVGFVIVEFMTHIPVNVQKAPPGDTAVVNAGYITWASSIGMADSVIFADQKDPDLVYYVVGHEMGHNLWLHHWEHAGGSKAGEHDQKDHNCIMSYSSQSCSHAHHRQGKYAPHFCGKCNLKLRGWNILHASMPAQS